MIFPCVTVVILRSPYKSSTNKNSTSSIDAPIRDSNDGDILKLLLYCTV